MSSKNKGLKPVLGAAVITAAVLFSGCEQSEKLVYKKGRYQTSKCRKELRNGNHFLKDNKIDQIVVSKKKHKLDLYKNGVKLYSFSISLGKNPKGDKVQRGDFRTPEGSYSIARKKCHPKYYRMISISYPSRTDRREARKKGISAGSGITIHAQPFWNNDGKGNRYTLSHDWTNGCIAVTNDAMDVLWYAVDSGTPIKIKA